MQHALAIQEDVDDRLDASNAGEVIDAFDHVLEALDEIYAALAEFTPPIGPERPRF
jgi:hypothetical protein